MNKINEIKSLPIKLPRNPNDIEKILVLCVDFNDIPHDNDISRIYDRFFSDVGNTLKRYFKENSYSRYIPYGEVHGWYRAPNNSSYYINNNFGMGEYPNNSKKLTEDIINIAKNDPTIDWPSFDTNSDGKIDNVIILHSGYGLYISMNFRTSTWYGHRYYVSNKEIHQFAIVPEYFAVDNRITPIAAYCHEFAHLLGLPDLYDTTGHSSGVGTFSVMAQDFTRTESGILTAIPGHLDAWSKSKLGFTDVRKNPIGTVELKNAEEYPDTMKYTTSDRKEYFLVENRQKTGFDVNLPAEGILIWHINENKKDNTDPSCYLVELLQADGLNHLENRYNEGDPGDSYPGTSNNRSFNMYTNPGPVLCNGEKIDILISNISNSGNSMTFDSIPSSIPEPPEPPPSQIPDLVSLTFLVTAGFIGISILSFMTMANLNVLEKTKDFFTKKTEVSNEIETTPITIPEPITEPRRIIYIDRYRKLL